MRPTFAMAVISLGMVLPADAAPARLPYAKGETAATPPPIDLNNSTWLGKYNTAPRLFIFEPDGTLSYKSPASKTKGFKNRGQWKLEGDQLFFEHYINPNQKLMEFRGTIKDANTITGEAVFPLSGKKEPQTLQRSGDIGR